LLAFNLVDWIYYQFGIGQLFSNFIYKTIEVVVVLALNFFITKQKIYLFNEFNWLKLCFWLFLILITIPFFDMPNLLESVTNGIMGGFSEELLCRGVILGVFLSYIVKKDKYSYHNLLISITGSSIIFGLMHLTNLTHTSLSYTLIQVLISSIGGLTFAFIYLYTGNIFYPIAVHLVNNWIRSSDTTNNIQSYSLALFGYSLVLIFIISLWYFRKHNPKLIELIKIDSKMSLETL
ncbi:CPBP family intramembrane glutamic endopeptidase, partial [Leuconostoc citreum]